MEPDDEAASDFLEPRHRYEDVAAELERIAEMLRGAPELNHHAAERLLKIARDIRSDLERLGPPASGGVTR